MPLDVVDPKGAVVKLGDLAKQSPEAVDIRGGRVVRLSELSADKGDIKALTATRATLGELAVTTLNVGAGHIVNSADGVIGFGVTPASSWVSAAGNSIIQFGNRGSLYAVTAGANVQLANNMIFDGISFRYLESGFASLYAMNSDGTFRWFSSPSGVVGDIAPIPAKMLLDAGGNLGVGATSFGASAARVLSLLTGTAPTTGPADTVQLYSSDDAAGHTIPSFFCEGTNVLQTGMADSASSRRVKMRINGTVVELLAI